MANGRRAWFETTLWHSVVAQWPPRAVCARALLRLARVWFKGCAPSRRVRARPHTWPRPAGIAAPAALQPKACVDVGLWGGCPAPAPARARRSHQRWRRRTARRGGVLCPCDGGWARTRARAAGGGAQHVHSPRGATVERNSERGEACSNVLRPGRRCKARWGWGRTAKEAWTYGGTVLACETRTWYFRLGEPVVTTSRHCARLALALAPPPWPARPTSTEAALLPRPRGADIPPRCARRLALGSPVASTNC